MFEQPIVLTKWNIGDVMFGPRSVEIPLDDLIIAANKGHERAIRDKITKTLERGKNG